MAFVNNWRTFDSRLIEFVRLKPILLYNIRLKDFRNKIISPRYLTSRCLPGQRISKIDC